MCYDKFKPIISKGRKEYYISFKDKILIFWFRKMLHSCNKKKIMFKNLIFTKYFYFILWKSTVKGDKEACNLKFKLMFFPLL